MSEPAVLFPEVSETPAERVPDLIVEVLSPSTARLDQHVKFAAYEDAGVGEHWIVDPKARVVVVNHQRAIAGEAVRSAVVEGFEVAVDELFPV